MNCQCGGETAVVDSRPRKKRLYRRRKCLSCGERFSTYEITVDEYDTLVRELRNSTIKARKFEQIATRVEGEKKLRQSKKRQAVLVRKTVEVNRAMLKARRTFEDLQDKREIDDAVAGY